MSTLLVSCLKIFFGRILDVSIGTVRNILTVKEKTLEASLLAFCEVFIWYVIVKDALSATGPVFAIASAYAAGFASGTYIGGKLAKLLVSGHVVVRVITSSRDDALPHRLREKGYGIAVLNVNGSEFSNERYLIMTDVDKKKVKEFESRILEYDPKAFVIVEDTKSYIGGYRPPRK